MFSRYYLLGLPGVILRAMACRMAPAEIKSGIQVLDHNPQTRADFTAAVAEAISLINRFDPIRFRRVQAQIRIVMNTVGIVGCDYPWPLRLCAMNLQTFYDPENPDPKPVHPALGMSPTLLDADSLVRLGLRESWKFAAADWAARE
ncbi:MAG: hypothetical protein KIS67_10075 [Verrucomicrobiae bacterium]|nr:hypothetical protein [Verrucomicrobiae bacterium]